MSVVGLVAEIVELASRVDRDEPVPTEALDDAAERAMIEGRSADNGQRAALLDAITALEDAVTRSLERIEGALRETGHRRGAIAAYGAVRPHRRAQNLRTRV